jgi:hypothetical protein
MRRVSRRFAGIGVALLTLAGSAKAELLAHRDLPYAVASRRLR